MSTEQNPFSGLSGIDLVLRETFDWYTIAKKEFRDTIRSRAIIILSVLFALLLVIPPAVSLYTDFGVASTVSGLLILGELRIMSVVVPVAGIALGYSAVTGERESGSMKLLLSLPYDRRDVLLGKLAGRSAALLLPYLGANVLKYLLVLPKLSELEGSLPLEYVVALVGLTATIGVVFLGFAIGASAATSTTRRSLAIVGGLWVYFFIFWNTLPRGVLWIADKVTDVGPEASTKATLAIKLLNPTQTYQTLVQSFAGAGTAEARASMLGGLLNPQSPLLQQQAQQILEGGVPWYLTDWAALLVLLFWLVVPMLLGYWRFEATDL